MCILLIGLCICFAFTASVFLALPSAASDISLMSSNTGDRIELLIVLALVGIVSFVTFIIIRQKGR